MKRAILALLAVAALTMTAADTASARGGHYGSRGVGVPGGYKGGYGSFLNGRTFGYALGLGRPYYGGSYYGYPFYASYPDAGCYAVRRRVSTPYGWRVRTVRACA